MKQRITPKQIDRLSEKGKKAYLAYCAKKGLLSGKGSWSSTEVSNTYIVPINKMECIRYPLLSIGQMIEFLAEQHTKKELQAEHYGSFNVIVDNPYDYTVRVRTYVDGTVGTGANFAVVAHPLMRKA